MFQARIRIPISATKYLLFNIMHFPILTNVFCKQAINILQLINIYSLVNQAPLIFSQHLCQERSPQAQSLANHIRIQEWKP